jgi:hypothetical protein
MAQTKIDANNAERLRIRSIVSAHAPLVALLREMYPATPPSINATDREIGGFIAEQRLIERLEHLLKESMSGDKPGELPSLLRGR